MPTIILPPKTPGEPNFVISDARSIVVIGANGSGKTRLGAFVEDKAGEKAHRVSAQRSLSIPIAIQPRPYDHAQTALYCGIYQPSWTHETHLANKRGQRWAHEPETHLLNDYEHLLGFLFADEAKRDREYARAARSAVPTHPPAECKLDKLIAIWSVVMPQRQLVVADDRISACRDKDATYEARRMSDGERVAIYLAGQALCAPIGGVVIIDEPELHLHRSIHGLLWDQIESSRPDCTFVYITHDLEFAATRTDARRVWLKDFDGAGWIWVEIETSSVFPDALAMEVLGSRRPILFVEGDDSSYDARIYRALFPGEHVVPRQSCSKVIEATKAMSSLPTFHHLQVRGLVDRDRRGDVEIGFLKSASIGVADVAEVENLLCIPQAISAVARQVKLDPTKSLTAAHAIMFDEFSKQRDQQVLSRALAEIQFRMNGFGPKVGNTSAGALEADLAAYVKGIDIGAIITQARAVIDATLSANDYMAVLRYFNCKGVVAFVANALNLKTDSYVNIVLSLLKEDGGGELAIAMRKLTVM